MDNMQIYNMGREVPQNAQKTITAGRLKGMTDINPMWRISRLTEVFGPCGIGWKYVITRHEMVPGANDEISCFVDIDLFYKWEGEWSEAIPGTGGSSYVAKERNGLYVSDECYKMALTDALSVACKALGIGADIYWEAGRSKYTSTPEPERKPSAQPQPSAHPTDMMFTCEECGQPLRPYTGADGKEVCIRRHVEGSKARFGRVLCIDCIQKRKARENE